MPSTRAYKHDANPVMDYILSRGRFLLRNNWQYLGFRLAAFAPPDFPWDDYVVRRFREEIDPSFLPLWMRHAYRTPEGSEVYFDYHCLAFESENNLVVDAQSGTVRGPHIDFITHPPLQAAYGPRRRPHSYISILHWKTKLLPPQVLGVPRQLSMSDFHHFREITWLNEQASRKDLAAEKIRQYNADMLAVDMKYRAAMDYRWDQDWNYLSRLVEKLTVEERTALMRNADPAVLRGLRDAHTRVGHALPAPA